MADRLLLWQRTDLPSKPRDDYLGRDLDRQRLYARVYRAAGGTGTGEWFWTLWRRSTKRVRFESDSQRDGSGSGQVSQNKSYIRSCGVRNQPGACESGIRRILIMACSRVVSSPMARKASSATRRLRM